MTERERLFWLGVREGLLCLLRAVEDYLSMPRSVESKRR